MSRVVPLLPVGDAVELPEKEAHRALFEHFDVLDEETEPMPLDELPALPTLVPTEFDGVMARLAPLRRR